ncbi:nucleotidyltransferase domain-containing protein [Herbiconiux sp. P18]|uniref:nucleotidyltransferase domain-containing protein n=1 Tax=Herbiconiux liangxiaofengii TaxID=3342795 RepID=UPI0035BB0AD2
MSSAAELLRNARVGRGLTQQQLAQRAGVTQSVVSAYESGRREPSLSTLTRLIDSTGSKLETRVIDAPPVSKPELRELVHYHRDELGAALGSLGASRIRLFGSVARGDSTEQSDIDLLVALNEGVGLFALSRMRGEAERILGVDVDVVPEDSLKPDVRESVLADAVAL